MNIFRMLLTISSWHPMTIWISSISLGFTAFVFIVMPLFRRVRSKRRLKKILKTNNAEAAIACIELSGFAGPDSMPVATPMYLIANNDMLVLTAAMDSSFRIEIPFAKITTYTFNGSKLDITVSTTNGPNWLTVSLRDGHNADGAFNRYALKHANIIDYIAARVPKKQVHIRV